MLPLGEHVQVERALEDQAGLAAGTQVDARGRPRLEHATLVLVWMVWMPFALTNDDSLRGFTTRAEVSRELVRAFERYCRIPDSLPLTSKDVPQNFRQPATVRV
jgi:hypothetical protein